MAAKRPKYFPPRSMEPYDLKALSDNQQIALTDFKISKRLENETYIRQHPELDMMIKCFLRELLIHRPANVRKFAATYFTQPHLADHISDKISQLQTEKQKVSI